MHGIRGDGPGYAGCSWLFLSVYNKRIHPATVLENTLKKVGDHETVLIVLRGNSASGKSSLARTIRQRVGRGIAIVSQDMIRRDILWEHESPTGASPGLIDVATRYALDHGYHVIVEGILGARRHGEMLGNLVADHAGQSHCFYLDIPWEETLRRHATKPQAAEYGAELMREWFKPLDLLPQVTEHRFDETLSLDAMTEQVLTRAGLTV
jgi:predicted kinase